jgi:hypothetical protein
MAGSAHLDRSNRDSRLFRRRRDSFTNCTGYAISLSLRKCLTVNSADSQSGKPPCLPLFALSLRLRFSCFSLINAHISPDKLSVAFGGTWTMRSFIWLASLSLLIGVNSGCGILRSIEQWKCDHLGMCHFGVAPTPPALDPCAPPAFQPLPCPEYGPQHEAHYGGPVEMGYPEGLVLP